MERKKVLFIGSHPDDIDLGCGICLHDHYLQGHIIKTIILTKGEKGNGGISSDRVIEQSESLEILAPKAENHFLDFPDTMLLNSMNQIIDEIKKIVMSDVPDIVYIPSNHDFHQDHVVTYNCAMAVFNKIEIPQIICYETPSTMPAFLPNYFKICDLDKFKLKIKALECHESQLDKQYITYESIYSIAKMRAAQARHHKEVAEAFEIIRFSEQVL